MDHSYQTFQTLLDQFKRNTHFETQISELMLSSDEFIYIIGTDQGVYYIFEIDYINDFNYIIKQLNERVGGFSYFVEAKFPPEKFEDTPGAKFYLSSEHYPSDFKKFKKYLSFIPGSSSYAFLIKK